MPDLSDYWPFVVCFGLLVAAGIGVPVPEELPTIGAGIWVASNPEFGPTRWLIVPVCFVGVLISDVLLYGLGRLWGPRLMDHAWVRRFLPPETRERTEANFHRYGTKILLMVRWVPAIRSPMFITAGIMRLPLGLFVLADGIAAVFGHSLLFGLAYWFGDQFQDLVLRAEHRVSSTVKPLLILTAILGVAGYFTVRFFRRPVVTGDPTDLPLIGEKVADKLGSPGFPDPRARRDEDGRNGERPHQHPPEQAREGASSGGS